jgi:sulfite reductase (NADPH) flavoprotein alpha-component
VAFVSRHRLNKEGSAKDTWHVEFDLAVSGLTYEAGDSFGLFPTNEIGLVDQIIAMLGASHVTPLRGRTLREVLSDEVSLGSAPDALFELMSFLCGGAQRQKARALAQGEDPDGDAANLDVLGALQKFSQARPHPEAFVDALEPLQPRLYSISSSPKHSPGRLTLTVDAVRYVIRKRKRFGVASTFLADRAAPGMTLRAYVQRAHGFALPKDPSTPVIMVGPGTGIAPFRSFVEERAARGASGANWLFFGERTQREDFLYQIEWQRHLRQGALAKLELAFSRDGAQKVYVQDRLTACGGEVFQWLQNGAYFYVCGDAQRMAKDVHRALVNLVMAHGGHDEDGAEEYLFGLRQQGRYQRDVY